MGKAKKQRPLPLTVTQVAAELSNLDESHNVLVSRVNRLDDDQKVIISAHNKHADSVAKLEARQSSQHTRQDNQSLRLSDIETALANLKYSDKGTSDLINDLVRRIVKLEGKKLTESLPGAEQSPFAKDARGNTYHVGECLKYIFDKLKNVSAEPANGATAKDDQRTPEHVVDNLRGKIEEQARYLEEQKRCIQNLRGELRGADQVINQLRAQLQERDLTIARQSKKIADVMEVANSTMPG